MLLEQFGRCFYVVEGLTINRCKNICSLDVPLLVQELQSSLYCGAGFQVLRNKPDFRRKPWPSISNSAKDFVKKLLVKDPRVRLTAAQALCMLRVFLFLQANK